MQKRRWVLHIVYLLVIVTLFSGMWGLNRARLRAKETLRSSEEQRQDDLRRAFGRLCTELSGDLYSAAEADSQKLYLSKLTEVQTAAGQALLLLSENGRQTPWITFWQSLESYSDREVDQTLERGAPPDDRKNITLLAQLASWLSAHPEVLLDETTESLPEGLELPTLQTAYAVSEEKTQKVARRALGIRGGLTELTGSPPGMRSYACNNARVDVLQSGELIYLSLRLKQGNGQIERERAGEVFTVFAEQEGFGKVQIIDLYLEDELYRGVLAPLQYTAELGRIPDLDRTIEIACTAWSGKICYFSAGRYFTVKESERTPGITDASKLEELARSRGARIGEAFLYRGRICRPLIYERVGFSGRAVLCVDVATVQEVDLFYSPHARFGEKVIF